MEPIRVFLVDDHAGVRISLTAFLEDDGFITRSVASGEEAIAVLKSDTFDVAIVDLRLGDLDGQNLIQRVHEVQPGLQFLIYTGSLGYRLPESLQHIGMEQGDILYKPAPSLRVIADAIRRLFHKRSMSHHNRPINLDHESPGLA